MNREVWGVLFVGRHWTAPTLVGNLHRTGNQRLPAGQILITTQSRCNNPPVHKPAGPPLPKAMWGALPPNTNPRHHLEVPIFRLSNNRAICDL
jgi:hypothetical protein